MKKIILLLLLIISNYGYSQNKSIEFKFEKKIILDGLYNSLNGYQYIKLSNKSKFGKKQDPKLICLDKNLNEKFNINVKGQNKSDAHYVRPSFSISEPTKYGNYFLNSDQLIDENGKIKHFIITSFNHGKIVNDYFSFNHELGYSFIGPRNGRKYHKKTYSNDDIFIYTIKYKNNKGILNKLKFPKITTNQKNISWHLGDYTPNGFFMISKDTPNKEMNIDTYHMAMLNFEGDIISYTPLEINLDKYHLFKSSNGGPTDFHDANFGSFSYGNVYYEVKEKSYYVYGVLNDKPKAGKGLKGNITGFYLHKFNNEGSLIWKKEFLMKETVNKYITSLRINFKYINTKLCIIDFNIGKNDINNGVFSINSTNGKLIKNTNFADKFLYKPLVSLNSIDEVNKLNIEYFLKSNNKIKVSSKTLYAIEINTEIYDYIVSKKEELFFDTTILEDRIILKEFSKKKRFLKLVLFSKK